MTKKKTISLKHLLNREFRNRIAFVFAMIFIAASLMTIFEISLAFKQFRQKLKSEASNLQSLVMSEIIVHQESSIKTILDTQNEKDDKWKVRWDESYQKARETFLFQFPFNLEFIYPLQIIDGPVYGALIFNSHLLSQPEILDILMGKILLMLFIYLAIAAAILPLAKRIPRTLIFEPIQNIIDGIKNETFVFTNEKVPYKELLSLEVDLKKILTDKKRLEDERVEVQKISSAAHTAQFLAHDIRKPMTLVRGVMRGLELMKDLATIKNFVAESKKNIERASTQMDNIFQELTMLKKNSCTNFTVVPIKKLIDEVVSDANLMFNHRVYDLSTRVDSNLDLEVDICSFKRALSNLVCNGIEATPDGGKVWITVEDVNQRTKDKLRITIGNSGSYISKEDQAKVFHLFYTAGKHGGSGLGLPIVQQIVRTHNGHVWINSSKDKGTEFIVEIPARRVTKEIDPSFKKFVASKKYNEVFDVLVIDDEEFNLHLVKDRLKEFNEKVNVVTSSHSNNAVKLATSQNFDLIICDIRMGKGQPDGFEITSKLRENGVESFIYIHTSGMEKDNKELAVKVGANLFGNKPFLDPQLKLISHMMCLTKPLVGPNINQQL